MYDVSAIDQVLLLAKNARGLTSAIDFISDALSRTDLFVFGELIDLPIVQQVPSQYRFHFYHRVLFEAQKRTDVSTLVQRFGTLRL